MAAGLPSFQKSQAAFPRPFSSFKTVIVLNLYYLLVTFIGAVTKVLQHKGLSEELVWAHSSGVQPIIMGRAWRKELEAAGQRHLSKEAESEECSAPHGMVLPTIMVCLPNTIDPIKIIPPWHA